MVVANYSSMESIEVSIREVFPLPEPEEGPYKELAALVRSITGNVTRQVAQTHSGVSHDTIAKMWRGHRPKRPILLQFAEGYGVDPDPLLSAAGYELTRKATLKRDYQNELIREVDPDALVIRPAGFRDLSDVDRARAALIAEGAAEAFAKSLRDQAALSGGHGTGLSPSEKAAIRGQQNEFLRQLETQMEDEQRGRRGQETVDDE